MASLSIHQQLAEAEQWVREAATAAAKTGKGQELARYRHEAAKGIVRTLEFNREHEAPFRQYMAERKRREA